jgi:hypothetical protein
MATDDNYLTSLKILIIGRAFSMFLFANVFNNNPSNSLFQERVVSESQGNNDKELA